MQENNNKREENTLLGYLQKVEENNITDLNNPSCCDCNQCCDLTTIITEDEFKFYKKYFKTKEGKAIYKEALKSFNKTFINDNGTINLLCPFLNNKKRCRIYKVRPTICRNFHCTEKLRNDDVINAIKNSKRERSLTILNLFK